MQQPKGEMSLHPNVRFKKLAFFESLTTLLEPSVLVPVPNAHNWQEDSYHFNLAPQQVLDISNNRYLILPIEIGKEKYINLLIRFICRERSFHVILRFCLLETSTDQEDYMPFFVRVKVNNVVCHSPVSMR